MSVNSSLVVMIMSSIIKFLGRIALTVFIVCVIGFPISVLMEWGVSVYLFVGAFGSIIAIFVLFALDTLVSIWSKEE